LTEKVINQILQDFARANEQWQQLISISFLSVKMKAAYAVLMKKRIKAIGI
jgi:hypothetical protein